MKKRRTSSPTYLAGLRPMKKEKTSERRELSPSLGWTEEGDPMEPTHPINGSPTRKRKKLLSRTMSLKWLVPGNQECLWLLVSIGPVADTAKEFLVLFSVNWIDKVNWKSCQILKEKQHFLLCFYLLPTSQKEKENRTTLRWAWHRSLASNRKKKS